LLGPYTNTRGLSEDVAGLDWSREDLILLISISEDIESMPVPGLS
jgi:hypothetical protein